MTDKQRIMCLALGRASPGMVLATPVYDREGAILLTAETVLDAATLEQMIRRGVRVVSVRVPDHRDEQTIAREMADIRERIETIFRGPGSDARRQMHDAVLDYRIENAR
jgi:acetolactate synthase small subunit